MRKLTIDLFPSKKTRINQVTTKNALGYIRAVQSAYKLLALNLVSVIAENITVPVASLLDKGEGARS